MSSARDSLEIASKRAVAALGGRAVVEIQLRMQAGVFLRRYYVGIECDQFNWTELGQGNSWDEAFRAAGVK